MAWWSKRIRNNIPISFVIAILVNVGMWFERYNIIVSSLVEDFIPGSWGHFEPGLWEIGLTIASFAMFFVFFFVFCKFFPIVSLSEIKLIMPKPMRKGGHH
jgi:molybdopterin-containing oxidoreductase family membrane subunit